MPEQENKPVEILKPVETPAAPQKKANPLAKFVEEQKPKQGPHGFDSHIVVPSAKEAHASGAVPAEQYGIRVLPNGGHGMVNPQPAPKK